MKTVTTQTWEDRALEALQRAGYRRGWRLGLRFGGHGIDGDFAAVADA